MAAASASRATPSTSYKFTMQQPSTSQAQLRTGYKPDTFGGGDIVGRPRLRITFLFVGERGPRCRSCGRDLKIAVIATPRKSANAAIRSVCTRQPRAGHWRKLFGDNALA